MLISFSADDTAPNFYSSRGSGDAIPPYHRNHRRPISSHSGCKSSTGTEERHRIRISFVGGAAVITNALTPVASSKSTGDNHNCANHRNIKRDPARIRRSLLPLPRPAAYGTDRQCVRLRARQRAGLPLQPRHSIMDLFDPSCRKELDQIRRRSRRRVDTDA